MARKREPISASTSHIPFPEYPNVMSIVEGTGAGPLESERHSHPWAEINVLIDGHATWYANDVAFEVRPGDGLLLMPQTPHHASWPPGLGFRFGTVAFLLGWEGRSQFGFRNPERGPEPPRAAIVTWLFEALMRRPEHHLRWDGLTTWWQQLFDEQAEPSGPYRALRVESALIEGLARFADPVFGHPEREDPERRGVARALRAISETLPQRQVSVTELARAANMSRSKFAEVFRRVLGMPPHAYAIALRVWMAQSALAGSRMTAASIAERLGFSSPQHFSRAFKSATSLTPNQYRRRWAAPWLKTG
jgi:AraC-like DNA-binding protein